MNKSRLIFVAMCSAVTLFTYAVYAFVLVPNVLPAREKVAVIDVPMETLQNRELLEILFPPDSWIFTGKTNVISFSDGAGMVLFREFEYLEGNQLQVTPCMVLCFPSRADEMTPQEKYRQAIVLEAENHALLELDGAIGFSSTPQLRSGQLNGIVTIRSEMKKANDASDDIEVITSDVLFDFNQIRTNQRVEFNFGPNKGHGRNLTIQMANTDESKKDQAPNTVTRIELRELGELRLYVENDDLSYSTVTFDQPRISPSQYHVAAYPQTQGASSGGSFQLRSESTSNAPLGTQQNTRLSNPSRSGQAAREQFSLSRQAVTPNANGGLSSQTSTGTQTSVRGKAASTADMSEVLVRCKGIVDMVADSDNPGQWLLTFRNQVDVIRTNPQGAADQLNCQELNLTFGQKNEADANAPLSAAATPEQETDDNPLASFGSLSPLRIRAVGTPVTARSPENKGFQAVGREMVLDLVGKVLSLTQGDEHAGTQADEVSVLYDQFRIKGKSIYYAFDDGDGPGKLDMPGAGTLEGTTGTDGSKRFKLQWNDELKVLPADKNNPDLTVVQIRGKPRAELNGIGTASSDEIFLWCDTAKKPAAAGSAQTTGTTIAATGEKWNVDMKKVLLRKNVVLKTDTGEILTNELNIDFQQQPGLTAMTAPTVSRYPGPQVTGSQRTGTSATSKTGLSKLSIFGDGSDGSKSTYTVRADKVDVSAAVVGQETVVDQIILTKNVNLDERTSAADTEPIHVSGQTVRITNPDSTQLVVNIFGDANVSGGHAVFRGRGVILMGANINVDRSRNLFWVDGQGELRISQQATASAGSGKTDGSFGKLFSSAKTGSANQSIIIDWAGSMEFNGKTLLFLKDVDVNYSMMAINKSEQVEVHLKKPFYFFEKDDSVEIEPERVVIRGNIDLERDDFDETTGTQRSHDRIRLTSVEIFPQTGVFKGMGPGYVSSIFPYSGDGADGLLSGGGATTTTVSNAGTSSDSGLFGKGLKFMQCNFNGSVEGNYETGQVAFHDRVVTMLCPARSFRDSINTNNTRSIVENGMLLECNKLEINQFQAGGASKTVDLKAEGNTLVEMTYDGRYYIANADKIKFEQAKNLITFEGSRNAEVVLYEAANLNAPTQECAAGTLIKLNPVTKEVSYDGFRGNFLIQ